MRAIDALTPITVMTGTIEADFNEPVMVLNDDGEWTRCGPGRVRVHMRGFEIKGTPAQADAALERLASDGFIASGANLSGWLYIRQPWTTDGDRVWGRYGMAIKCRPPASAATRKTSGA